MNNDPFKEYIKDGEPDKARKGYAWSTAIGLQAVDGLKPSKYLVDTANLQPITNALRKRTRYPLVLPKFYLKMHLAFHLTNISEFIANCLMAFTNLPAKSEIII